jgi:hypothetical protein
MTHPLETLRRFTLENRRKRQFCRNLTALKTSHVCTGDTLLELRNVRNRKFRPGCAQAVQDRYSLWKALEKRKEIPHRKFLGAGLNVSVDPAVAANPMPQHISHT